MKKRKKEIIFILGPTGVGKSETAVYLAKIIGAEIISCDSMQIYKGLKIISAHPKVGLLKRVKHHLLGVIPLSSEYNASLFRKDALKKIKDIHKKGRIPLVVGGTGLYSSILIDGIFQCKAQDKRIRDKFYRIALSKGSKYLHDRLKRRDPLAAKKIHFNDTRRIVRALEVFEITGKPITLLQSKRRGLRDKYDIKVFCLNMPKDELYNRINNRVEKMFKSGLVSEVKGVLNKKLSKTVSSVIGLKEVEGFLRGEYSKDEAKEALKLNTRHYAKRQLTWFRKDKSIVWINLSANQKPKDTVKQILSYIERQ